MAGLHQEIHKSLIFLFSHSQDTSAGNSLPYALILYLDGLFGSCIASNFLLHHLLVNSVSVSCNSCIHATTSDFIGDCVTSSDVCILASQQFNLFKYAAKAFFHHSLSSSGICLLIGLSASIQYHHINHNAHVAVKAESHTLALLDRIHAIIDKIAAPQIQLILHHFPVQSNALSFLQLVVTSRSHFRDHHKPNGSLVLHIHE
jgi:hypothetical protein